MGRFFFFILENVALESWNKNNTPDRCVVKNKYYYPQLNSAVLYSWIENTFYFSRNIVNSLPIVIEIKTNIINTYKPLLGR